MIYVDADQLVMSLHRARRLPTINLFRNALQVLEEILLYFKCSQAHVTQIEKARPKISMVPFADRPKVQEGPAFVQHTHGDLLLSLDDEGELGLRSS